jgi:hypothetical protein
MKERAGNSNFLPFHLTLLLLLCKGQKLDFFEMLIACMNYYEKLDTDRSLLEFQ